MNCMLESRVVGECKFIVNGYNNERYIVIIN